MRLDERVPHPDCLAKYAAAFFRMSRSSVTRRSSAFSRRSSSVCEACACHSAAGAEYALIHWYRLCWLTPIRADTSAEDIKRAYRKLARKYHPDVSKEADAETRFKEIGEAYEVLKDPEKRTAYDTVGQRRDDGADFSPPPGWDQGFEFHGRGDGPEHFGAHDHSDFFEALFGRGARSAGARRGPPVDFRGEDHHAKVTIDLEDTFTGAHRGITLRMPAFDAQGRGVMQERTLEISIPKGIRAGQQMRLAGQGGPGLGDGPDGDLFLEIEFKPHPRYRADGRDLYVDLQLAPWEAALGAAVPLATPTGTIELTVPPSSTVGRKLRLKGRCIPGEPVGDLCAVLTVVLPAVGSEALRKAYESLKLLMLFTLAPRPVVPRGGSPGRNRRRAGPPG